MVLERKRRQDAAGTEAFPALSAGSEEGTLAEKGAAERAAVGFAMRPPKGRGRIGSVRLRKRHGRMFNSKEISTRALLSVVLGVISVVSCTVMIYLAYLNNGQAELRSGGVVFLCLFFSLAGLILAILSRREPEKRYAVSYLGMVLNGAVLVLGFVVIYLGLGL